MRSLRFDRPHWRDFEKEGLPSEMMGQFMARKMAENEAARGPIGVESIRSVVAGIARESADDEVAHGDEDALWENVLEAIAGGAPDPAALASEALKTREIKFARWCA